MLFLQTSRSRSNPVGPVGPVGPCCLRHRGAASRMKKQEQSPSALSHRSSDLICTVQSPHKSHTSNMPSFALVQDYRNVSYICPKKQTLPTPMFCTANFALFCNTEKGAGWGCSCCTSVNYAHHADKLYNLFGNCLDLWNCRFNVGICWNVFDRLIGPTRVISLTDDVALSENMVPCNPLRFLIIHSLLITVPYFGVNSTVVHLKSHVGDIPFYHMSVIPCHPHNILVLSYVIPIYSGVPVISSPIGHHAFTLRIDLPAV